MPYRVIKLTETQDRTAWTWKTLATVNTAEQAAASLSHLQLQVDAVYLVLHYLPDAKCVSLHSITLPFVLCNLGSTGTWTRSTPILSAVSLAARVFLDETIVKELV